MMMENYRSTPEILAACNSLIEKNQDRIKKDLLPMLPGGAPVLCHHAANSEQEARWLAGKMQGAACRRASATAIWRFYTVRIISRAAWRKFC